MLKRCALIVLLGLAPRASDGSDAGEHVLAGARLFRAERYPEALVEFRVAERLGAPDAAGYAAASLVKLGRAEEAVEAFASLEAAGAASDPLLDYYRAVACYQARLYACSDRLLSAVGGRSGPRIGEYVREMRSGIAALLAAEPSAAAIDWYHERGARAVAAGRPALGAAYYQEAAALGKRRRDAHRRAEALAALLRLAARAPAGARR